MEQEPQSPMTNAPGVIRPWLLITLIVVAVGAAGYFGWYFMSGPGKKTETIPTPSVSTSSTPTTTKSTTPTVTTTSTPTVTATVTTTPTSEPSTNPNTISVTLSGETNRTSPGDPTIKFSFDGQGLTFDQDKRTLSENDTEVLGYYYGGGYQTSAYNLATQQKNSADRYCTNSSGYDRCESTDVINSTISGYKAATYTFKAYKNNTLVQNKIYTYIDVFDYPSGYDFSCLSLSGSLAEIDVYNKIISSIKIEKL